MKRKILKSEKDLFAQTKNEMIEACDGFERVMRESIIMLIKVLTEHNNLHFF